MNEVVNPYFNPYMPNIGVQTGVNTPPANNYKINTYPEQGQNVLNYSNPTYNQLVVNNNPRQDQILYSQLYNKLDNEGKALLNQLAPTGKLYSRKSNDGSSTLQQLNKIMDKPRASEFNSQNIIKATLKTLKDPYIITQNFGAIPQEMQPALIQRENSKIHQTIESARSRGEYDIGYVTNAYPVTSKDLNFEQGHTCPAANVEFNLADRSSAEFVRYVEGITSPEKCVKTVIDYADFAPTVEEAHQALDYQNSEYRQLNPKSFEITLRPDDNAYIRGNLQEENQAYATRSLIDVGMQSLFMNEGSRRTYNSLTDKRSPETGNGKGLNDFEISFIESIADSKSRKQPVIYMELDDQATKILKYNYDFNTTKNHLVKSLDSGNNVITSFLTDMDEQGNLITPSGHTIMLTGYEYDKNGKLWFKCNDTDDGDNFAPSWKEADSFIPTIYNANVPGHVLEQESALNQAA